MILDNNQKLAIKLFKPTRIRYMENLPDDITVISGQEGAEFGQVDIMFDTDTTNNIFFKVRVDNTYFLCDDGKLREDYSTAGIFYKDGKKQYDHIINRAMECVAFYLLGRFKKVTEE
jgi:hypothetical protein